MRAAALPLLLGPLLLAGCLANDDRYPSLLPRDIESQGIVEPERPPVVAAPDPALDKQLADLTARLDSADKAFTAAARSAEARVAVAQGMNEGTSPWLDAQVALSELDTAHAPIVGVLAELADLAIQRGETGKPVYPAIEALTARATTISRAQTDRISMLEASLKGN